VSAIVINYPGAQQIILVLGGGYLGYVGYKSVKAYLLRSEISALNTNKTVTSRDGFFIAFLNPKTGVFFLALFSQFIRPENSALQSTIMVMTAFWVDALWYVLVSFVVLHTRIKFILIKKLAHIDLIAGICFISIAGYVLIGLFV
jgi:threonine/homoserine/homoserine lactone efflux protein